MTELNIVPECYIDTKVAEIAGQATRKYNHQHGCGDVARQLKIKLKDNISLGIIDEDKNKGPVAKYFLEFADLRTENNVILKKHNSRQQYLILICPEIETWLLKDAKSVNIKPHDYGLPNDLNGLIRMSKTQNIDNHTGFHRFVKALISTNAPSISTLKGLLDAFNKSEMDKLISKK